LQRFTLFWLDFCSKCKFWRVSFIISFLFLRAASCCVYRYWLLGFRQSQLIFLNCIVFYSYYIPATCFGPYGPSSSGLYTSYFIRSYFSTADPLFVFLVIDCIYFLTLCFGDFSPLSACIWWMCLLIILIHYLNICHFILKLIKFT
jgi:hypothetical protein